MSKTITYIAAGAIASIFAGAATLHWWENKDVTLTPEGEKIRTALLDRMKASMAYGDPSDVDHCAAHYIAHQQAGRLEQDRKFTLSAKQSKQSEQEIDSVIAVNHQWDSEYALRAYGACMTGMKPPLFSPQMFKRYDR